jgi:Na+/H+-translocating membrane pyrophosphatase
VFTAVLLFVIYLFRPPTPTVPIGTNALGLITAISFLTGAFCSALAGYFGVWTSVRCNLRCAAAAAQGKAGDSLKLAFAGGAISAIVSAAMCILGVCVMYLLTLLNRAPTVAQLS